MKRDQLKEYFRRTYDSILLEQDEDPFATEEEGDDAAEEEGDDAAEEEGGDVAEEEGGEEAEEEGDDAAEEEGPKADEEDHVRFSKSLDDKLQAIFIDIEADSIKSAEVQAENLSLKYLLLREAEGDIQIDVDRFAAETARLILNFDSFFDIEEMILSKSRSFLLDKYGEEVANEVEELLSSRHSIAAKAEIKDKSTEYEEQVPIAVGAMGGTGA